MIPETFVLAPLSKKDQAAFLKLCADFVQAKADVVAFSREARVAKKVELKKKLIAAPADEKLRIAAEISGLQESFEAAKKAANDQLRTMGARYNALFFPILDACQKRIDGFIATATSQWDIYLEIFETKTGEKSPVVRDLLAWKETFKRRRTELQHMVAHAAPTKPNHPTTYLGYSDKP